MRRHGVQCPRALCLNFTLSRDASINIITADGVAKGTEKGAGEVYGKGAGEVYSRGVEAVYGRGAGAEGAGPCTKEGWGQCTEEGGGGGLKYVTQSNLHNNQPIYVSHQALQNTCSNVVVSGRAAAEIVVCSQRRASHVASLLLCALQYSFANIAAPDTAPTTP